MNDTLALGWLPDTPDFRDYTIDSPAIKAILGTNGSPLKKTASKKAAPKAPASVDLRQWCAPIEDQKTIGSCTANAGVGLMEYYENRAFGKHLDASRLFLYKVTRNLLHWNGDTGAYLRKTMAAMALFGIPPEEYWPYDTAKYDVEPNSFCYSLAENYKAVTYYRLDPPDKGREAVLKAVKDSLAANLPCMFGFTVYSSIFNANGDGKIPYPAAGEKVEGGHAVVTVGYDDNMKIKNKNNGATTTGALLIRNSWGEGWGDKGYGWLPYQYILKGQAVDFWNLIKADYLNTGNFN